MSEALGSSLVLEAKIDIGCDSGHGIVYLAALERRPARAQWADKASGTGEVATWGGASLTAESAEASEGQRASAHTCGDPGGLVWMLHCCKHISCLVATLAGGTTVAFLPVGASGI